MSEWKHDPGFGIPIEPSFFEADQSNMVRIGGREFNLKPSNWKPTEVTLKPMLFVGTDENTAGGWHNFEGYFPTVEHAKHHVLTMSNLFDWAHIVVDGKIKVEGLNMKTSPNYPSVWKFVEIEYDPRP